MFLDIPRVTWCVTFSNGYLSRVKKDDPVYNFDGYVRLRRWDFQRIYKQVKPNLSESKTLMNEQQWKQALEKFIVVGDLVYTKVHEPKNKLTPRFEGPYKVIEIDDSNDSKIRHLTTNETKTVHWNHLKRQARSQDP